MHDILHGTIFAAVLCLSIGQAEAIKKDIVYLMDTSGSISDDEVKQAVDFIYNVTKWLTIGPDDIQVSVVTFDTTYSEKFKLSDYNSSAELRRDLKRLAFNKAGGGTRTAKALEFVRMHSFRPSHGGRLDANRTVILLTDGQSTHPSDTLYQAGLLKSLPNTEIFAIGIGSALSTSNDEIRGIASDPDSHYVQQVDSFIYLCNAVPALVPKLDPSTTATAILNCPTPPPTTQRHNSGHLGGQSLTTTPTTPHQQTRTTRATPHQQTRAVSTANSVTSRDIMDNDTEGEDIIPLAVGVGLAAIAALAAIVGGVIWRKRAYQVSPGKAGQSDVPWMRQYNEAPEGQLNTKFNPASLR